MKKYLKLSTIIPALTVAVVLFTGCPDPTTPENNDPGTETPQTTEPTTYTLTYHGNGAGSGSVPAGAGYTEGATVTVAGNTGALAKTGYLFTGWNTAADGVGTGYVEDDTFDMPAADVALYAAWVSYKTVTDFFDLSGISVTPNALECDGAGGLYVTGGSQLYQISGAGIPSLLLENTTGNEPFYAPRGMTICGDGLLYIANNLNRDILRINSGGTAEVFLGTTGTSGNSNDPPVSFARPYDLAYEKTADILYVADSSNHSIRKIELSNENAVSNFASFSFVYSVEVDEAGNVYACSGVSNVIQKYSPDGMLLDTFTLTSGTGTTPSLYDIALGADGTVYAADYENHVIRRVGADGSASLFAGQEGVSGDANGALPESTFNRPNSIDIDAAGTLYVSDSNQKIRRIVLE